MGRKYYCDFCDKRIPPGLVHRKNHNQGHQHIHNRRIYYQQFQSGTTKEILLEERMKKICHQWNQTGTCSFGENCKYSHRSNFQLMQLNEQQTNSSADYFFVNKWIQKKLSNPIILLPESICQ